jgi:hypothetical protein
MFDVSRRRLLIHALGYGASFGSLFASVTPAQAAQSGLESDAAVPSLRTILRDPLLVRSLYRLPVSREFSPDGAAGTNRNGYQWIEEQRQGAEWIVRAYAQNNREWMQLGWRELDWGLGRQQPDGGFASKDGFHSTSFFVEALARSCLIDPDSASTSRAEGLVRAARWLMRADIEEKGARSNSPYTHRRYILAAALGQAGAVSGDKALLHRAEAWAEDGLRLQRDDGTNPEKDGYDVGYQMVGVLMALRCLPVCRTPSLRAALRAMVRRAVELELSNMDGNGAISADDSTRIGHEYARSGKLKVVPYGEILQALVYAAHALPQPQWLEPAARLAERLRNIAMQQNVAVRKCGKNIAAKAQS